LPHPSRFPRKRPPARSDRAWAAILDKKISRYAGWYNVERPNSGLGLRTPEEIFRGTPARQTRRVEAGNLVVDFMDGDRRLPIFRLRLAA
jgi:hypothetical protein